MIKPQKTLLFAVLTALMLTGSLSGCSSDKPSTDTKATSAKQKPAHNPFDHSHDEVVTDVIKHQFEHEFADQCVARELKNSVNPDVDKQRLDKDCMCISKYLMKDLSADEAKIFLKEHQSAQSLSIKFDAAAYFCLQNKQQPKGPQLFGRQ